MLGVHIYDRLVNYAHVAFRLICCLVLYTTILFIQLLMLTVLHKCHCMPLLASQWVLCTINHSKGFLNALKWLVKRHIISQTDMKSLIFQFEAVHFENYCINICTFVLFIKQSNLYKHKSHVNKLYVYRITAQL